MEEAQRGNQHKTSINKVFNDEVVSPVKQKHVKLDFASESDQKLSANQVVESLAGTSNQRYASNPANNRPGYGLSSSLNQNNRDLSPVGRQLGIRAQSNTRLNVRDNASYKYDLGGNDNRKPLSASKNRLNLGASISNTQMPPATQQHSALIRNQALDNSEYITATKASYVNPRIPLVNHRDQKYLRYKPEKKFNNFDA